MPYRKFIAPLGTLSPSFGKVHCSPFPQGKFITPWRNYHFGMVNSKFWEFLTFFKNNFIITKMINILLHVFKIKFLFQNKSRKPPSTRMTLNIGWLFWRFWNSLCVCLLWPMSTHLNRLLLQCGYVANFHDSNLFSQDFQTHCPHSTIKKHLRNCMHHHSLNIHKP